MIEFHLDGRSDVAPYLQVVRQVRQALRLGVLREGDQLPSVREVVEQTAMNPNTVLKAYRHLEHEGLVGVRQGVGTFVTRTLAGESLAENGWEFTVMEVDRHRIEQVRAVAPPEPADD